MNGTALHVRRFLLIEHPGPWGFDAVGTSGINADVIDQLVAATRRHGGRTLLIRRHGRLDHEPRRAWAVADVAGGTISWGSWEQDADLLAACDVIADPPGGSTDPVLLVCTHGRHDTCCAVRGRPIAAALTDRWPGDVWECSHVGGDRFAGNVVVLPDGTYYGNLGRDDAVTTVERHLAGVVDPERLRGSSMLPPVAQAAAIAAHERFGPAGPRDVRSAVVASAGHERWRVELTCAGPLPPTVVADVEAQHAPAAMLTCRAPHATSARSFVVTDVRAPSGPAGS
jgi:hypothetical protein